MSTGSILVRFNYEIILAAKLVTKYISSDKKKLFLKPFLQSLDAILQDVSVTETIVYNA